MKTQRVFWLVVPIVLAGMVALAQTEGTRANIVEKSGNTIVLDIGSEGGVTTGMEGYFWTKTKSGDRDYHMIVARFRVARVEAQRCWVTAEAANEGYTAKDFQWATFAVKLVPATAPEVESAPIKIEKQKSEKAPVDVPTGKSLEWYMDQANALFAQGNYARAKEFYLMIMKLDPEDSVAMDKYAQCQRKLETGDLEKKYLSYLDRGDRSLIGSDAPGALSYYLLALQAMPGKEAEVVERFKKTSQKAPKEWGAFSKQNAMELSSIWKKYFYTDYVNNEINRVKAIAKQIYKNDQGLWEAEFVYGIKMVFVQGGTFQMGDYNHGPIHTVLISRGFWLGKFEITEGQWKKVMSENPPLSSKGDNYPVNASWEQCQMFIQKLNEKTNGNFCLPTEAEWEYAGRQPYRSIYTDDIEWDNDNSSSFLGDPSRHPVGRKQANSFGLYDMLGNVAEWCQDWYDSYSNGDQADPSGPSSGSSRVLRGGSFNDYSQFVTSTYRSCESPSQNHPSYGFRLAMRN